MNCCSRYRYASAITGTWIAVASRRSAVQTISPATLVLKAAGVDVKKVRTVAFDSAGKAMVAVLGELGMLK